MGMFDQVFVVPTEPLEKLATSDAGGDLISVVTVAAANHALWRVHVFNQLVLQQTIFNAVTHSELRDAETTDARKEAIGQSARIISQVLHHYGVDGAASPGGWYERLKNALAADIEKLTAMTRPSLRRWVWSDRLAPVFAAADVLIAVAFVSVVAVGIFEVA
jgi:hypothetical protein